MKKFAAVLGLLAASLLSVQTLAAQAKQSGGLDDAMKAIDSERMRATVKYLSDDALEGRGTGQKGGDLAADWIAAQFKSYGLQPAGDNGTFFQQFELVSEAELEEAMRAYAEAGIRVEGAAAAPLALARREWLPRPLVLIVTGRNVDDALYNRILTRDP